MLVAGCDFVVVLVVVSLAVGQTVSPVIVFAVAAVCGSACRVLVVVLLSVVVLVLVVGLGLGFGLGLGLRVGVGVGVVVVVVVVVVAVVLVVVVVVVVPVLTFVAGVVVVVVVVVAALLTVFNVVSRVRVLVLLCFRGVVRGRVGFVVVAVSPSFRLGLAEVVLWTVVARVVFVPVPGALAVHVPRIDGVSDVAVASVFVFVVNVGVLGCSGPRPLGFHARANVTPVRSRRQELRGEALHSRISCKFQFCRERRFRGGGGAPTGFGGQGLLRAVCLSLVGDPVQLDLLWAQDWVETWEGWKELEEDGSDDMAMELAQRFLRIAGMNIPTQRKSNRERLTELKETKGLELVLATAVGAFQGGQTQGQNLL